MNTIPLTSIITSLFVDDAKKEIESLIYYGSLKTKLEKIS